DLKEYFLYAIKKVRGSDEAPLDGGTIIDASSGPDPTTGKIAVNMTMNRQGAKKWADMTAKAAADNNREIAVVLDNEVYSCPGVNSAITGGRSEITGNFSVQEGQDLANILKIGKLPAGTEIIQESLVGPYLGKKNIQDSLWSLVIGLSLVLIFMVLYYSTGGIVAIIALLANLFFIFGALASFGTVLTLPGFAGVILTIGMAVDANVIIFERIREELREGKSVKMAIRDGFKHSYSAIIDANVTTLLTAVVLVWFGLGPIKGFAVVLIIGILSSLFTAVLLGRMMIEWWTDKDRKMSFWTGFSKNAFANLNIDWVS
ncbi:MAG: protein translocase subunit SecD, partial [Bacteroidota bacterium]